jgi:hypothetical protein
MQSPASLAVATRTSVGTHGGGDGVGWAEKANSYRQTLRKKFRKEVDVENPGRIFLLLFSLLSIPVVLDFLLIHEGGRPLN